jgi:hypothetical protein
MNKIIAILALGIATHADNLTLKSCDEAGRTMAPIYRDYNKGLMSRKDLTSNEAFVIAYARYYYGDKSWKKGSQMMYLDSALKANPEQFAKAKAAFLDDCQMLRELEN